MFKKCLLALLVILLPASLAQAAKVTLKIGYTTDVPNPYPQALVKWSKDVAEKSNGDIEIQLFPAGQLGTQREMNEGVILGTLDMSMTTTAVMGNFVPEFGVFDLPFIFRSPEHAYKALDTIGKDELGKKCEARGFKILSMMENGIRQMTNNKHPIRKPEDMRGLKVRVMEQPVYLEMMRCVGASPTPMSFGEVYTSLQKGVIDGQENPLATIYNQKFYEVQKYISLTGHTYSCQPMIISMKVWNKLSPEHRKLLQETVDEALVWERDLCRRIDAELIASLKATGKVEIEETIDKESFATAMRPAWDFFAKRVKGGQELIDRIVAIQ